ncbi:hypothetical protein KFK09_005803 [Dendrobium nobile]|uniref:Retrovirus-related Pol polyprotein from transposon TNT 1-94-like beta-barrel domain-containing protein n=1 Tax=Dendrobium nobile TaxID=94219 RepID=A0A8T3C069_DENNO|nr:hypothetical protein KFK09_005803 [Dendrobium nobile]
MSQSSSSQTNNQTTINLTDQPTIPSPLKLVLSHIKTIVPASLSSDNYPIWKFQILKLLRANGFDKHIDITAPPPPRLLLQADGSQLPNPAHIQWKFVDQNIAAALCSTISPSILPYVLHLDTCSDIWHTLEQRLQASNRSRVLQLKNELHNISMKNQSMDQYLTTIKSLVYNIATAGSSIDSEDIIMYTLNGLPPSYQAFKMAIRTKRGPVSLDELYSYLLTEEITLAADSSKVPPPTDVNTALFTSRGRGRRGRGRSPSYQYTGGRSAPSSPTICQICNKRGHSAPQCWHRMNANYIPAPPQTATKALVADTTQPTQDWYIDSGASSHFTNSSDNLQTPVAYQGMESITVVNGQNLQIANSGSGILPTPNRKILLSKIYHVPNLTHNLLYVSNLTNDNNVSVSFSPSGFSIKDQKTKATLLRGPCRNGLYTISNSVSNQPPSALSTSTSSSKPMAQSPGPPKQQNTLHYISSKQGFTHFCI